MDEKIKGNLGFVNAIIPKLKREQELLNNAAKVPVTQIISRYKLPPNRPASQTEKQREESEAKQAPHHERKDSSPWDFFTYGPKQSLKKMADFRN